MTTTRILAILILGSATSCGNADRSCTVGADSPAIAVYVEDWGRVEDPCPQLHVAVWPDGRIIWARRESTPDPPLLESKIDPAVVSLFLSDLQSRRVFDDPSLADAHFGPDSAFTVIHVASGGTCVKLRSWHESFEANPQLVATDHGIEALSGRTRDAVLKDQSNSYRRFRQVWAHIQETVSTWLPATGTPFRGQLDTAAW